jgi:hypothetical protein
MATCCEICGSFLTPAKLLENARDVTSVVFGQRTVRLCRVHAFIAAQHRVTTVGGLSLLFRENRGRRSFLPRRAAAADDQLRDEQRAIHGRRASDLRPGV